ncbi:hypothetical protein A1Q1_03521 [Trichosporon asahii var. asahii CBS 2479]|uniref:Uncharacterized protein n=1 Tax=Trichosporon asahii var. asahii (strain ATCC 90039 / CBS 2479 / JCM 2466 / KCTC 7840 / NBRC 103889/ NCYC 2677 / UAMH 7654) TaxID=1186058 RepID=J5SUP9_TRIAS|nr:hypothetical protein A1Q1_03521 [Trichosporon asahii var. asahii CBS 2479]EJT47626.1 hypothetical protein A1Q1_03521 [Trichosporon asahii var. asahii CBS 2479]
MAHASSVRRVINQRPDSGRPHTTETRRGAAAAHMVAEEPQAPRNTTLKDTTQAGGMLGLVPGANDGDPAMNVHKLVRLILTVSIRERVSLTMISFPISSCTLARSGASVAHLNDVLESHDTDGTLLAARLGRHQQNMTAAGLEAVVSPVDEQVTN